MQSLADFLGVTDPRTPEAPAAPYVAPRSGQEFALAVVNSRDYRDSIQRRIILDELPPQVEGWLLNMAYGKPIERVEVKDTTDPLDDYSVEQLEERAMRLLEVARQLRRGQSADDEPAADDKAASVH